MARTLFITLFSIIISSVAYAAEEPSTNNCLKTELFQDIKRQSKSQLEKAALPDEKGCDGLTYEQLRTIDFTQINLDNYFKAHPLKTPRPLSQRITEALQQAIDNPTDENVKEWLDLQEEAKKKAKAFTDAVQRLSKADSTVKPKAKQKVMKLSKKHQAKVAELMQQFNMTLYCSKIIGIEGYPRDSECDRLFEMRGIHVNPR